MPTPIHALAGVCVAACVFSTTATCGADVRNVAGDGSAVSTAERKLGDPPDHLGLTDPFGTRTGGATTPAATSSRGMHGVSSPSLIQLPRWNPAPLCGEHVQLTDPGSEFPAVKLSRFFQADSVWFDQGDTNQQQVGDLTDGADFRPARLAAPGEAWENTGDTLTDEKRHYIKANGVFTRVVPKDPVKKCGGRDEWEIAGRWSTLDLSAAGINGGRLTDLTAGLEWHLNPRTKVQFNYIRAFLNRSPAGVLSDADILAARTQIDF